MSEKKINEIAREERNRYHREWRERNKEKVKMYNERYWKKRAQNSMEIKKGE